MLHYVANMLLLSAIVSWQRVSVVRSSFFGWRTLPDLRLIYGWHVATVGKVSAMGQPTRPTQPSIALGSANE